MASGWEKTWLWSSHIIFGEHFACKLPTLLYAFIISINICLFPYLIAASSKLSPHAVISAFHAPHTPGIPSRSGEGWKRRGRGSKQAAVWFGELLWVN